MADRIACYMVNNLARDYGALHEVCIDHVYETFYVLFVELASYLRSNPNAGDGVLVDLIAQTLRMEH